LPQGVSPRAPAWRPAYSNIESTILMLGSLESFTLAEPLYPIYTADPPPSGESAVPSETVPAVSRLRKVAKAKRQRRHHCTHSGCSKSFISPKDLRRHVGALHTSEPQTFKCQFCNSKLKRKDNLAKHVRNVHTSRLEGRVYM
jgi:uncharacterized Zn-finger protein